MLPDQIDDYTEYHTIQYQYFILLKFIHSKFYASNMELPSQLAIINFIKPNSYPQEVVSARDENWLSILAFWTACFKRKGYLIFAINWQTYASNDVFSQHSMSSRCHSSSHKVCAYKIWIESRNGLYSIICMTVDQCKNRAVLSLWVLRSL